MKLLGRLIFATCGTAIVTAGLIAGAAVPPAYANGEQHDLDGTTASRYEAGLAWLCGFTIEEGNRRSFDTTFREDWRASTADERTAKRLFYGSVLQMMKGEPLARAVLRLKTRGEILAQGAKQPTDPLAIFLLRAHRAAHPPLAQGEPLLTEDVVSGFLGLLMFTASDLAGVPEPSLSSTDMNRAAASLSTNWPAMSVAKRQSIVDAPLQLAALRYRWPTLPISKKEAYRAAWRKSAGPAVAGRTPAAPTMTAGGGRRHGSSQPSNRSRSDQDHDRQVESETALAAMQHQIHEMNMDIIRNMAGYNTRTYDVY